MESDDIAAEPTFPTAATESAPPAGGAPFTAAPPSAPSTAPPAGPLDLDGIEGDLADVEVALARLDAGTYWTDEITGEPLAGDLLARRPTARRAHSG